jgi:26S proteasome regulatory subunit N10
MPLECCMILLDDSQYMRNGDYIPTRCEAQQDAANLIVGAKTQSNPQTTIGICCNTIVQLSPTDHIGDILTAIHSCKIQKYSTDFDVCTAVAVASLALKHRQNKNGMQRIVLFCGTPITSVDDKALTKTGKMLKKNNVHIDVILFGEESHEVNLPKLQLLVNNAAGGNLVHIPTGVLASDVLVSSPILADVNATVAQHAAEFGGVDPNMDPELAMALRVSMEEERARQERAALSAGASSSSGGAGGDGDAAAAASNAAPDLSEEEAMLQQALAMSMNENEPTTNAAVATTTTTTAEEGKAAEDDGMAALAAGDDDEDDDALMMADGDDEMDDDAAMQMALQMSLQQQQDNDDMKDGDDIDGDKNENDDADKKE